MTIKESDNLATGAGVIGTELCGAYAIGDVIPYSPKNRAIEVVTGLYVTERIAAADAGGPGSTVDKGHDLPSGALLIRGELGGANTGSDLILHSPQHSFVVIGIRLHIYKGIVCRPGLWAALGPPQEGHGLGTGTILVGTESGGAGTGGDFILYCPEDRLVIVIAGIYVLETGGRFGLFSRLFW